MASLNCQQI